ncbi:MAG: RNase adapter RapZ [Lachnospiraceae bacterium]
MRFVIVTGMSGGGKSTALKMLEDMGFYCVDNLPVPLIGKFVELIATPNGEISKVALGLDIRADQSFIEIQEILSQLTESGYVFELLFVDASNQVLLKRYKESRRIHPLAQAGRMEDSIQKEREILVNVKARAHYVIDTSNILTRELKQELEHIFVHNKEYNSLMVNIMSFGFKNGIPADSDLVFDVRFLPNPYYIEELKYKTGADQEVRDYVMNYTEAQEFLNQLTEMLEFLIPNYVKEGKYQLVVSIGCTGGKHRSVTLANELYARMKNRGNYGLTVIHRDIKYGN